MSEWQPARLVFPHETGKLTPEQLALIRNRTHRVRLVGTTFTPWCADCPPGAKVYAVHREDVKLIWPEIDEELWVCEHEILTD